MSIQQATLPYYYIVSAAPALPVPTRNHTRAFAILVALFLLVARAPEAGVVPGTEILPLNDTQSDLTLSEVVARLDERLSTPRKSQAYKLGKLVLELSERHQISPALILAVIEMESSYRFTVVSKAGAVGLMQLQPETAAYVAKQFRVRSYHNEESLNDPEVNLRLGVAYLAKLRREFGHSLHYLAAYNVGPTSFKRRLREGRYDLGSLDAYVRSIHVRTREIQGSRSVRKFRGLQREEALMAASI